MPDLRLQPGYMESASGWTKVMRSCITIFCFQYTIEEIRSTSGRLPTPQLPEEPAHKPVDIVRSGTGYHTA